MRTPSFSELARTLSVTNRWRPFTTPRSYLRGQKVLAVQLCWPVIFFFDKAGAMRDEQEESPPSTRSGPSALDDRRLAPRDPSTLRFRSGAPESPSCPPIRASWSCLPLPFRIVSSRGLRVATNALVAGLLVYSQTPECSAEPSPEVPEVGHNYGEHETPRMTALGGAVRGNANSLTSLYSNPAGMATAQLYHVGAFGQIYPEARRQSYGAAVVDSLISSTGLAGGLGGVWTLQDPDGIQREWMDLRFGLGMPLGDVFFLGLTAKYVTLQQNGNGPLGASQASGGLPDTNIIQTVTFDAGVTLKPAEKFSIGLTGHNLSNPETTLLPLMGGLGAGYADEDFALSVDGVLEGRTYDAAKVRVNAGGEFLAIDRIALRAGYRFDQGLESHALNAGAGYVDTKYSIDASLRRGIAGPGYFAIVFGFTVHVESLGLGASSPDAY